MQSIENVLAELRPPMLDDHGLQPALEWTAKLFSARSGIAVAVRAAEPDQRLEPEVEMALFRIAQEALNNVLKHAQARSVLITLEGIGRRFEMAVVDDGVGLPGSREGTRPARPGLGMVIMRERAEAIGGRLDIEDSPAGGTKLTVTVPK
jgi:two-component system, NarL family, sensor histidine kinase UhpB